MNFKKYLSEANISTDYKWMKKTMDDLLKGSEQILDYEKFRVGKDYVEFEIPGRYYQSKDQKQKIDNATDKIIKRFKSYNVDFSGIDSFSGNFILNLSK